MPNRSPAAARLLAALLLALPAAGTLSAQPQSQARSQALAPSIRVDAESGRDLANYAAHRDFDHTSMVLSLDFPDFENEARASARCALTMTPLGSPRDSVRLDARGYTVTRVSLDGADLPFEHDDPELRVTLPRPVPLGESITLEIVYDLGPDQMAPNGRALSWSPPTRSPDNPTEAAPLLHSQGQPNDASAWFPCYDFPLERLSTELIVTVHDGFEVVSNGQLVSREDAGDGRVRWHWRQELPHAPYLVSLVIGKFDVVELGGPDSAYPGIPIPVYGPVGAAADLREAFADTPAMIRFYEDLFDEPYPWAKYSQAIARDFAAGAMENTSASTFFPMAASAPAGSIDDIIAHELVHQWFGNLVTCRTWAHLWLNEGWATFGEALWAAQEARTEALAAEEDPVAAESAARSAYLRAIRPSFRASAMAAGLTSAPESPALASNYWLDVEQNFMKADNPYSRGACILHMLRERLGDEVFWTAVRQYLDRHRFDAVETDDFRRVLEDVSGESLERFFDQWVYRAGAAKAEIELFWQADYPQDDNGPGTLTVTLRQVQPINADNPAYAMVVPLHCRFDSGAGEYVYVKTEERVVTTTARLERMPENVSVDPFHWNILNSRITRDLDDPAPAPEAGAGCAQPVAVAEALTAE